MSNFQYWIAEGVQDAAFIGKLLTEFFGATRLRELKELDDTHRRWLGSFKWPINDRIDQAGVPVPLIYKLDSGDVVSVRNAVGVSKISKTLDADFEHFDLAGQSPTTLGIFVDCDDEPPTKIWDDLVREVLKARNLDVPETWGVCTSGTLRVGVFSIPEPGAQGTLEDLLLPVGRDSYPELASSAEEYAKTWSEFAAQQGGKEWKPIKKPAGRKKAALGAMGAVLKPGYALQNSIEQNDWIREATQNLPELQPLLNFMRSLLNKE